MTLKHSMVRPTRQGQAELLAWLLEESTQVSPSDASPGPMPKDPNKPKS